MRRMNERYFSRRALVALVVVISLLAVVSIALASNLLVNGGFNADFVPQSSIRGIVPTSWTAVNVFGNPRWIDSFSFCNCGGNNEKTEGTNAVVVESQDIETPPLPGKPFDAVLYQQVNGVANGMDYSFAAAMLTFCGGTALPSGCDSRGYTMTKQVGIDPTGGTSPTAPSVVWSAPNGVDHRWQDMTVVAKAQASSLTVFIRVIWPYQFHGAHTYWDASYLTLAPTATLRVDSPTSSGTVNLFWLGRAPQDVSGDYPGIKLGFDIQVRKLPSGAWTNLLTTTQSTSTSYTNLPGSYQFRALPVLFQQNSPQDDPTRRFVGLYTDPVTVTILDTTPPTSAVAPLASLQTANSFTVSWAGSDNISPPSALLYTIQYRDGNGAWLSWFVDTSTISATFNGLPGHTYYFRSRARDEAGNLEAVHPNPDTFTTVAVGSVSGTIRNVREQPIPVAAPSLTPPAATSRLSDINGQYTLYVTVSNTYALNVVRAGFGSLPALCGLVVTTGNLSGVDVILPPRNDLIANGQFETGNLSGWTTGGSTPPTITSSAHSGSNAAQLGSLSGGDATLQQSVAITSAMSAPTLSFLYKATAGTSVPFTVSVIGATTTQVTPSINGSGWTHGWLDLSAFAGQTVMVQFAVQQPASTQLFLLDEVELGSAEINTTQTYLPLVNR